MIRNALALFGAVAILGYFKGYLTPKIPTLEKLPLPQVTFNAPTTTPTGDPKQQATAPTPQPTPEQKKRWGLEFEYKGRLGL